MLARLAALLACLFLASFAPQQKAPEVCPWCKNDPALMAKAGVLSHGPIPIGPKGSADIVATLPATQWVFLETAHLRWGSSLGTATVDLKDKPRVEAELARLRVLLPTVPEKVKKLDPFLRLHLFGMRGEELYARFQKLLRVTDADFPSERQQKGPYMGNGRFLGEADKFEVVIHGVRATHVPFTQSFTGAGVTDAVRWHFRDLHKMIVSVPAEDPDLRQDKWLFPHVAHNLSHLFFCAYKHFSYDPPVWLDEGLAHAMEKEIEPESMTTDGEEGAVNDKSGPPDWLKAARAIVASDKGRSLADLLHAKEFAELDMSANIMAWSKVRFLIDTEPERFAKFLGLVKGQLDAKGVPNGQKLDDLQRNALRDLWSWSPADFDTAWRAWLK
ncbi:MAG TPA: hypothetical protein VM509_04025 [Planctomycetota bacterium]|nr:hypothetical protein [Planctomycetota bacterium]